LPSFDGRSAVVVGAASSIGRACAARLESDGAEVLAEAAGSAAETEAREVAEACEARWGRLDVLVYCAAAMDFWDEEIGRASCRERV